MKKWGGRDNHHKCLLMNAYEKIKKESTYVLTEISNHLIINGNMVFFSGLLKGKLGISLFFFHYWRYTENSLYKEYTQYLIELVKSQIHDDYPLDYECGLAGVGAGFDYLRKYEYFDAGDDLIHLIDSRIIKAISYEDRVDMLTGFGRYLLSRQDNNPTIKDSLIQLVDLLTEQSQTNMPSETISFLCDLFLLNIRKEKVEYCISRSIDALINDVKKEPVSRKLLSLIKLSQLPSYKSYNDIVQYLLKSIFGKKNAPFTEIRDLQWLLQLERLIKDTEHQYFLPKIKTRVLRNITSFHLSKLDELFRVNQNFALKEGYAGLGMALLSVLNPEFSSWANLL
jgi:lantibiotic modifying enzyme